MKKIISIILSVITILSVCILPITADYVLPFTDVSESDYSYIAIKTMYENGYMSGVSQTRFGKDSYVSRAMICLISARVANAELSSDKKTYFKDVPSDAWYTSAVNWAYENHIMSGISGDLFAPESTVTLEQAAVIIYNIAKIKGLDTSTDDNTHLLICDDYENISSYAVNQVNWASNYGIVDTSKRHINPKAKLTREDIAVIFSKFLDFQVLEPLNIHKITFADANGKLYETKYVIDGEDAEYTKEEPTLSNDSKTYYFFKGWDKELTNITEDTYFTAVFETKKFPFNDVAMTNWAYEAVKDAYFSEYLTGITENIFGGMHNTSRAMLVMVCAKIADAEINNAQSSSFTDVKTGKWYNGAVNWAYENGIVSGMGDGRFNPDGAVTREQTALIIRNFIKYLGKEISFTDDCYLKLFSDRKSVSSYARDAMSWATVYGIFNGNNNKIRAKDTLTRYELAVIIRSILNYDSAVHKPHIDVTRVQFIDWNGNILQDGYYLTASESLYKGATPKRAEDDDYTYSFKSWQKKVISTYDITYTATYTSTEKSKRKIDPNKPMIAITFDDGPGAGSTSILNTLEKYNVVATFFDIGYNIVRYPDIIKREAALGCEIGNHTYNHPVLSNCTTSQIKSELNQNYNAYKKILGYGPKLCRPPYGSVNSTVKSTLSSMGIPIIYWSIDTLDWKSRNAASVYNIATSQAYDGAIILMHSLYTSTAEAVAKIVPALLNRGYQLVTVSELAKYKGYNLKADGTVYYNFK